MKLQYYKPAQYTNGPQVCPHNQACMCEVKKCNTCGWHPSVAKARMEKLGIKKENSNG